jgi:hypothetical protein
MNQEVGGRVLMKKPKANFLCQCPFKHCQITTRTLDGNSRRKKTIFSLCLP